MRAPGARSPGYAVQSSKAMAMSDCRARCTSIESSGRHVHFGAVHRRTKTHALLADLAQRRQAEHLEAAGIGEDGPLPAHKAVQTVLMERDDLRAGAQREMQGIAENDLRAQRFEFLGRHAFDGAVGAHRHEGGRIDGAVRQLQARAARGAVAVQHFKAQLHARAPGAGQISMASP